ncbi:MAG: hypothetical protein AAB897_00155 [Patescibacteria group bacterium]
MKEHLPEGHSSWKEYFASEQAKHKADLNKFQGGDKEKIAAAQRAARSGGMNPVFFGEGAIESEEYKKFIKDLEKSFQPSGQEDEDK